MYMKSPVRGDEMVLEPLAMIHPASASPLGHSVNTSLSLLQPI
jgi:hypothetical protein